MRTEAASAGFYTSPASGKHIASSSFAPFAELTEGKGTRQARRFWK
jgi:hypothetical protein